jgi:DNA segregation ATPase FtsK/SpoIIIE-like protein
MALLLINSDTEDNYYNESDYGKAPAFAALAKTLDVDLDTLRDEAGIKVKAEYAAQLQALKDEASAARKAEKASAKTPPAKPAQGDLPLPPAAQATGVRGGGGGQGTRLKAHAAPAGARARSAHLSKEEAQLGIAAAMQSMGEDRPTAEALPAADVQSGGSAAELKEGHSKAGKDAPRSELFQRAVDLVRKEGKVNVRLVKAGLSISTDRAGAIIKELEAAGIVTSCNERGARQVIGAKP